MSLFLRALPEILALQICVVTIAGIALCASQVLGQNAVGDDGFASYLGEMCEDSVWLLGWIRTLGFGPKTTLAGAQLSPDTLLCTLLRESWSRRGLFSSAFCWG